MRRLAPVLVVLAALLAGCSAQGQEDPFAYMRKPLYTGHFELEPLADGKVDSQEFRVEDGSISRVRVLVWVNATAGAATVEVRDPSGKVVLSTTQTADQSFPLILGVWSVTITGQPDASGNLAGHVGILAARR